MGKKTMENLEKRINLFHSFKDSITGPEDPLFGIHDPHMQNIMVEFKKVGSNDYSKESIMSITRRCEEFLEKEGELTEENKEVLRAIIEKHCKIRR